MKRIVSFIAFAVILISQISFGINSIYAIENVENEDAEIKSFIHNAVQIIQEHDRNNDYVAETTKKKSSSNEDNSIKKESRENSSWDNEVPFSDTAFQTCRLIIKASKTPDKLNSTGMANGFKDWYIIQFRDEEDTKFAYTHYASQTSIIEVYPDIIENTLLDGEANAYGNIKKANGKKVALNSWGGVSTGLYDMKDHIKSIIKNPKEIVVGMIDSGINYNLGFFSNRLIRTYTNFLPVGELNDEMDIEDHGTGTAATIIDCTPNNIKVAMYRAAGEVTSITSLALAMIQAANDEVDIINCSFQANNSSILHDAIDYAIDKDVVVVASSGNWSNNLEYTDIGLPAAHEGTVSVAACSNNDYPATWCRFGSTLDLMAPGENIPYLSKNGTVIIGDGTSLSAPFVSSAFAQMMTIYPEMSNKEIERRIESTAKQTLLSYDCSIFGYGVIDIIDAVGTERLHTPIYDKEPGKYLNELFVEITADPGTEIYYTLDQRYPSKEEGILYTGPIEMPDNIPVLRAVAYKDGYLKSDCSRGIYRVQTIGTPDMFDFSNGTITSYHGSAHDIIIPELMVYDLPPENCVLDDDDPRWEKTVYDIAPNAFADAEIYGITIRPLSYLTNLKNDIFSCNPYLTIIDAPSVESLGSSCFKDCYSLSLVDMPNIKRIGESAFSDCYSLGGISFPLCNEAGDNAFRNCVSLRTIDMPSLEYIGFGTFTGIRAQEINLSKLHHLNNEQGIEGNGEQFCGVHSYVLDLPNVTKFGKGSLQSLILKRLELSVTKEIDDSLMTVSGVTRNGSENKYLDLVLPATLNKISNFYPGTDLNSKRSIVTVYGNKGTYAEQWASKNRFEFIEITPESAVITDLPDEFYDYMRYLYADVVGFNRTYQWYGSYSDKNTGGVPIEGANEREFVPKGNKQYPYYYCIVTSKDVGFAPIEIKTGSSRYVNYAGGIPNAADYTGFDEILSTIPEDLSIYTDESVEALNNVVDSIDRNLDVSNQATVDGYVEAISSAIDNLQFKTFTVTFFADEQYKYEYSLKYGEAITKPDEPYKNGYSFKGWTPEIPETMPTHDLNFHAVFEENGLAIPSIGINNYVNSRTVDYKATITFTAITKDMPDNATIYWYIDGEKAGEGERFTVDKATDAFSVQAKVIDVSGKIISSSETELIKVKTDFFSKIIAFFRMLFGKLPIIEQ